MVKTLAPRLTIVIGTNRPGSLSAIVAHYMGELMEEQGVRVGYLDLQTLPKDFAFSSLYAYKNKHPIVNRLNEMMEASEHYLFVVPQYNGSFPGVLKTFIDGYASPQIFKGKKAALIGVSKGWQGNLLGLHHFSDVLQYLGMEVYPLRPTLGDIAEPDLALVKGNAKQIALLKRLVKAFLPWAYEGKD